MTTATLPMHGASAPHTTRTWHAMALWGLFALCCFTRLYNLGHKAIMHDETLFVFYTLVQLYKEFNYGYMPILHGPASLLLQSLTFHVFGVSDFTMRLSCALMGIGGFWWVWSMRFWLGNSGTWIALVFYTLSPAMMYWTRFFHMDALYLFISLWIVASFLHWWRSRSPAWCASALLGCTMLFVNKESSLFLYFSILTFTVLWLLHDIVAGALWGRDTKVDEFYEPRPRVANPAWFVLLIGGWVLLCVTQVFEGIKYDDDVVRAIGHDWVLKDVRSFPILLGWQSPTDAQAPDAGPARFARLWSMFYVALLMGTMAVGVVVRFAVQDRWGHRAVAAQVWRAAVAARFHLLGAIIGSVAIYLLVFNTFFVRTTGFFKIYADTWSYWGGQHEWGRIYGPFHQHMVNMLVYELPSVLIVGGMWLVGVFRLNWTRHTAFAFFLIALPVAAFHKLIFSGMDYQAGAGVPEPLQIRWLVTLFQLLVIAGVGTFVLPRLGKLAYPALLGTVVVGAIVLLNSTAWTSVVNGRLYRDGEPVRLANRHVHLNDFMEISFNFDGGTSLVIVIVLVMFAAVYTWWELEQGRRFRAFLIWWFVTATGAASYAREAVPQVGIHAMLPLLLLGSHYAGAWYDGMRPGHGRRMLAAVLVCASVWTAKASINLCFHNADEVRERLVYGHTPQDLKQHFDHVAEYAKIAPLRKNHANVAHFIVDNNRPDWRKDVRVGLQNHSVIWPGRWYLRDIEWREEADVQKLVDEKYHFIFANVGQETAVPGLAENYIIHRGCALRFWLPRPLHRGRLLGVWKNLIPGHYQNKRLETEAADAVAEWDKILRYMTRRETFNGGETGGGTVSASDYLFCIRKDLY